MCLWLLHRPASTETNETKSCWEVNQQTLLAALHGEGVHDDAKVSEEVVQKLQGLVSRWVFVFNTKRPV